MGNWFRIESRMILGFAAAILLLLGSGGCSVAPTVPTHALIRHQALVDFAGLDKADTFDTVRVSVAAPQD